MRRIEAVKFICCTAVRRVRPLCREGNNNDTLYVKNGSRQQAHNAQRRTQAFLPSCPSLITSFALHYPVYRSMLSVVSISATRVASNFYHDLIDRFSMSDALLFAFLFDSRNGTVVTERRRRAGGKSSLPYPRWAYIRLC